MFGFNFNSHDEGSPRIFLSLRSLLWTSLALSLAACASIGNPSGGPRDEDPPRFVRSNPAPFSVDFNGDELLLYFDEIVNVKDAFSKVIMSPPTAQNPRVSSLGRRVSVKFQDTLKRNTTYTIDFSNSIEDNNEGNPLDNFSFTFSTGPDVDSLGVSGMVLGAEDLEPMQRKLVGLHSNLSDFAVRKIRFDYVARTDDRGRFNFQGLRPGNYRVYAIDDADGDMKYSSPEELFAFSDFTVSPSLKEITVSDTIRDLKTGYVDTVVSRRRFLRLPNDIVLRPFMSRFKQQYLAKYERIDTTRLNFIFNSPSDHPATYSIVGASHLKNWAVEERSPGNDTVTLWIKPMSLVRADTLNVAVAFMVADSMQRMVPRLDTLRMTFDRKKFERVSAQALKEAEKKFRQEHKGDSMQYKAPEPMLEVNVKGSATQDVDMPLIFETSTPLSKMERNGIRLEEMIDSVWRPVAVDVLMPDSLQPRKFELRPEWKYATNYKLTIDSLSMEGIYGTHNKQLSHEFKTRDESDYSSLLLHIVGLAPGEAAFVQVLQQDKPVKTATVVDNTVEFPYLQPGKYNLRLYEDFNGNGVYDPGDFDKGIGPDLVYYYPKKINLKKNWSKEETWDIFATPLDLQKPEDIRTNKPDQRKGITRPKKNGTSTPEEEEEE